MNTILAIINHYNTQGAAPYSVKELAMMFGTHWLNDKQQVAEFGRRFVICTDGIIRPRMTVRTGDGRLLVA